MRHRTAFLIITIVVPLLVLLGGAMSWTHSGMMTNGYHQPMMGNQQGNPGMMGGNQSTPTQQGTPVIGITRVTMHHAAYQPTYLQVRVGTTVTWTNQDDVPHTVTFRHGMSGGTMMGSGMMTRGQSFSLTFRMPGTYQYSCLVHPSMVATVTVVS